MHPRSHSVATTRPITAIALLIAVLTSLLALPAQRANASVRAGGSCTSVGRTVTVASGRLRCQSVINSRGRKVKVWVRLAAPATTVPTTEAPWPETTTPPATVAAPASTGLCGAPSLEARLAGVPISARLGSLSAWVNSVEGFFATELQRNGQRYCPPAQYIAQSGGSTAGCGAKVQAAFCPREVAVAWDADDFAPTMVRAFGEPGFALVLAHENGHLAQSLLTNRPTRPIHQELQADCFSGAWLRGAVAEGRVASSDVARAVAISLVAADEPGFSSIDTPDAHGSGFDRIGAIRDGYTSGVSRCIGYASSPPPITARLYSLAELVDVHENDLRTTLDMAFRSLNGLLTGLIGWTPPDRFVDYRSAASQCLTRLAGASFTDGAAAFCNRDTTGRAFVAVDTTKLANLSVYYGDTAALAILAYVWFAGGLTLGVYDETPYVLETDCWIGAWFRGEDQTKKYFSLYPGDMDEVIGGVLSLRANGDPFTRVAALQAGYLQGINACTRYQPSGTTPTPATSATVPATTIARTTVPVTAPPTTAAPAGATVTLVHTGGVSPGVTAYAVDATCMNVYSGGQYMATAGWSTTFPTSGGTATMPYVFTSGSTCSFRVGARGATSTEAIYVTINGRLIGNGVNGSVQTGSGPAPAGFNAMITVAG